MYNRACARAKKNSKNKYDSYTLQSYLMFIILLVNFINKIKNRGYKFNAAQRNQRI